MGESLERRPRVAFLTPLNPLASGISDYSEELLPYLARHCDVHVYTADQLSPTSRVISDDFVVRDYSDLPRNLNQGQYDDLVIQLGNSPLHVACYDALLRHGGVAVFHDLNLSGIIGAKTLARGNVAGFLREMLPTAGIAAFTSVLVRFIISRQLPGPHDYWMNRAALRKSRAIIVHNEHAAVCLRSALTAMRISVPVWKVLHGVPMAPERRRVAVARQRARLGLASTDFVVGSFGVLDESKRLSVALRAFRQFLRLVPNAVYLLVGRDCGGYPALVDSLGLTGRVRFSGHVDFETFLDDIVACDFCINLRYPSHGETSGALLRMMSLGKPVAVTNRAQFREFPEDVCIRVDPGPGEEETLCRAMYQMADNPEHRAAVGERARSYVEEFHSLDQAARGYVEVIRHRCVPERRSALTG
ncbi:MAG TPA: glycosyltransferase family 4 protein [Chloroflexota bacterium]|nr:glycosyltransferase family 4 protein [Chloroflexota bacterium]